MQTIKSLFTPWLKQSKLNLRVALTCLLLGSLCPAWAGLVLSYNFDESSGDALDAGTAPALNGAFKGSAARVAGGPSTSGSALSVNGANGTSHYLSCGNLTNKTSTLISNQLTLVTWINLQGDPGQSGDRIADNMSGNGANDGGFGWIFQTNNAANAQFRFIVNNTYDGGTTNTVPVNLSNRWVFLALTYNATNSSGNIVYYSGTTNTAVAQLGNAVTYTTRGAIKPSTNEFRIGSTPVTTGDRTPPAWFDNVRVYNTVLTTTDLEALRAKDVGLYFTSQPANQSAYDGLSSVTFSAAVFGTEPISKQWYLGKTSPISGATNTTLTLNNITASMAGTYYLFITNAAFPGGVWSSNATLTVLAVTNTPQLTNIWNLRPGDRTYLSSSAYTERGLAYNPLTANLLLVSRPNVVVLSAATGAEQRFLKTNGIPGDVSGKSFGLNLVGVAQDGAVYGAGLTTDASLYSYCIYRWADDGGSSTPVQVYNGNPGGTTVTNLRWGDNFAIRGGGTALVEILIAPATTNTVALLQSQDGVTFTSTLITVSGVASGFAQNSLCFGSGNTFWAKTANQQLVLVQYDATAGTGTVLHSYADASFSLSIRGISADVAQKWLAGVSLEAAGDNVRLFDVSDLQAGPVQKDQELFYTHHPAWRAHSTVHAINLSP